MSDLRFISKDRIALFLMLARAAFFAALAFTFYSAVVPASRAMHLTPWDKATHFLAFYGLTGLAIAAYPKRHVLLIGAALSGFGALIEFVQGLPMVNRDRDFWDWVADSTAIVFAAAPMLLYWWRQQFVSGQK